MEEFGILGLEDPECKLVTMTNSEECENSADGEGDTKKKTVISNELEQLILEIRQELSSVTKSMSRNRKKQDDENGQVKLPSSSNLNSSTTNFEKLKKEIIVSQTFCGSEIEILDWIRSYSQIVFKIWEYFLNYDSDPKSFEILHQFLEIILEKLLQLHSCDKNETIKVREDDESIYRLVEILLRFANAIHSSKKLKNSELFFQTILLTLGEFWEFLKSRSTLCPSILNNLTKSKIINFRTMNTNCRGQVGGLLRLSLIMFKGECEFSQDVLDWIIEIKDSENVITYLLILIQSPRPEILAQIQNSVELISRLRLGLLSPSTIQRKESICILQCLTFGQEQLVVPGENPLFNMKEKGQAKFWTDFFDLLEILDEKQIHIVKPVLPKLKPMMEFCFRAGTPADKVVSWYFVLLNKMVHHDNRLIAKEGLSNFLEATLHLSSNRENQSLKNIFLEFLRETLLPVLKQSVGWILPEAQYFFENAKKLGGALILMCDYDFCLASEFILTFINNIDTGLGPPSVFFFILSLSFGILEIKLSSESSVSSSQSVQLQVFKSYTTFLLKGITALDKFLRLETQKLLANICCRLITIFHIDIDIFNFTDPLVQEIFGFLGAFDNFVISGTNLRADLQSVIGVQEIRLEDVVPVIAKLSPLQIFGLYRFSFLSGNMEILEWVATFANENVNKASITVATIDFLKSISFAETSPACLTSQMNAALYFWKSEQGFESRNQSQKLCPNFEECQRILETIAESAAKSDKGNNLLGILSNSSLLIDIRSRNFGNSSREDYELLRFCGVFLKFVKSHPEPNLIEFPGTLLVENFSEIFQKTDPSNYCDICDKFRASFITTRLSALTLILTLNRKGRGVGNPSEVSGLINEDMLNSVLDQVDVVGPQGIISILQFIRASLPFIPSDKENMHQIINGFLGSGWTRVFEMRKTESFWTGVQEFTKLIVHPYFTGESECLLKYAKEIFDKSQTVTGISLFLMESLAEAAFVQSTKPSTRNDELIQVCLEAICFGPPLPKRIKVTYGIWEYIQAQRSNGIGTYGQATSHVLGDRSPVDESSFNFVFHADAKTRLIGIRTLKLIVEKDPTHNISFAVRHLLNLNDLETKNQKMYFGNSATHRIKQRIAQALLVFQSLFDKHISEEVMLSLMNSLTNDSPQPSVRYLKEWIIIRSLLKFHDLHTCFFETAEQLYRKRVGFGSFVSTICLHVAMNLKTEEVIIKFSERALRTLTTLFLGHHFTVRLYARVCFRRIYENILTSINPELANSTLNRFQIIYENIQAAKIETVGNISKISQNIDSDFYVEIFQPEAHYRYEIIFIHLPRISGMATDELIQENDLLDVFQSGENENEEELSFNTDPKLILLYTDNEKYAWHLKAVSDDGREMGEEETTIMVQTPNTSLENGNFQKKLNPWKFLSIAPEISDFPEKLQARKRGFEDGLIVVASLVDRVPNLGGLCRTCEIFGVTKYVIAGLKSMEEQQFQNLSVSAQMWIDILEVPVRDLSTFLTLYSKKGYTILGVEQALESVPLNRYEFPKKSLLLLGNEKFGIPPNLLDKVDQCLEVPQVGVIRSLNVHVTGALCIWQYAMQHVV